MHDAGYAGKVRVLALLFVALSAVASAGCGASTGGSGAESENPRPIEAGGAEDTGNAASGTGTTTGAETTGTRRPTSSRVEVSTLATDLRVPWSFAFLPDGDALVTGSFRGAFAASLSGRFGCAQSGGEGAAGTSGDEGVAATTGDTSSNPTALLRLSPVAPSCSRL